MILQAKSLTNLQLLNSIISWEVVLNIVAIKLFLSDSAILSTTAFTVFVIVTSKQFKFQC
jgi:hypothetical protein